MVYSGIVAGRHLNLLLLLLLLLHSHLVVSSLSGAVWRRLARVLARMLTTAGGVYLVVDIQRRRLLLRLRLRLGLLMRLLMRLWLRLWVRWLLILRCRH